jgi:methyl-accepting chemotaxis protein
LIIPLKDIYAENERIARITTIIGIIGIIILILVVFWIANRISAQVENGLAFTEELRKGNLAITKQVKGKTELARLMHNLEDVAINLSQIVAQIRQKSELVESTGQNLLTNADDLVNNAQNQSENSSKMLDAVLKIHQTSEFNKQNANEISIQATDTAQKVKESAEQMQQTISLIHAIASQIKGIDDISRKTDILAINASIIAAQAGDQGLGFAVVADEVRKLAEQSQQAAQRINSMIKTGVDATEKKWNRYTEFNSFD